MNASHAFEVRVETDLRGVPSVHFDPVLKNNNPRRYHSFVKRCHRIGILSVGHIYATKQPYESNAPMQPYEVTFSFLPRN